MPRHVEAILDGVALSACGPFIIQAVHEDPPTLELTEGERPGRDGSLLLSRRRQLLKVALEVAVRELFDLAARARAMETLAAWSAGLLSGSGGSDTHLLQLSNRPDRRLHVVCTADPSLGSVRDYTAVARIEFTAYTIPYWEDEQEDEWTMTGTAGSASVMVAGTAPSPLCLTVTLVQPEEEETEPEETEEETDPEESEDDQEEEEPETPELTSFSVTAGGQTITFEDISVTGEAALVISRDALDNLAASVGTSKVLSYRTAESADDLMLPPGPAAVSFEADADVSVVVRTRGRWR